MVELKNDETVFQKHYIFRHRKIGVDHSKYRKHHVLDDAKLLREVYLKLVKE